MHTLIRIALRGALILALPSGVHAGAEKVRFPDGYRSGFVRYSSVDKPERKPPIVRFLYVNTDALAGARPGVPLPDSTVIVMEDHPAVLDAAGQPVHDPDGRFVAAPDITNVFVQEKRAGWGTGYAPEVRNGEWEYARFKADGTIDPKWTYEKCFSCHKSQANADFNFTFTPFVESVKAR